MNAACDLHIPNGHMPSSDSWHLMYIWLSLAKTLVLCLAFCGCDKTSWRDSPCIQASTLKIGHVFFSFLIVLANSVCHYFYLVWLQTPTLTSFITWSLLSLYYYPPMFTTYCTSSIHSSGSQIPSADKNPVMCNVTCGLHYAQLC